MFHGVRLTGKTLAVLFLMGFGEASQAALSGNYTVGGGEDYPTISAAVSALNSQGISGPVDFIINSGTYNEQVTIQSITRSGNADDEVTFRRSFPWLSVIWTYSPLKDNVRRMPAPPIPPALYPVPHPARR